MKVISLTMNSLHVNVTMLRVMVSLSETQSFSRTAEHLGLTQSAVSHAVRGLENVIEAPLMHRGRNGIRLTSVGERVLASARIALDAIVEIGRVREAPVRGTVHLALINSASVKLAPDFLAVSAKRHPQLKVEVLLGTDREVADWVECGAADLGISFETTMPDRSDLLFEDEFYAITSASKRSINGPVAVTSLDNKPFIMSEGGCAPLLTSVFEASRIQPDVRLSANDMGALLALVGAGQGISIVPGLSLPHNWEVIVQRFPIVPSLVRPLWLIKSKNSQNDDVCVTTLYAVILEAARSARR